MQYVQLHVCVCVCAPCVGVCVLHGCVCVCMLVFTSKKPDYQLPYYQSFADSHVSVSSYDTFSLPNTMKIMFYVSGFL